MDALIDGYRRFRSGGWIEHRPRYERLAREGQAPRTLIIACADSRVDPQQIFAAGPGELFTLRNVANLVPPYAPGAPDLGSAAAIEYAVRSLGVTDIAVLGHSQCGGIKALCQGDGGAHEFVMPWVRIAARARDEASRVADPAEMLRVAEQEAIRVSLDNLMSYPWIGDRVGRGDLRLHGLRFNIESGELYRLADNHEFNLVA